MILTSGKNSRTSSRDLSDEPLSTKMSSVFGYVCFLRDGKHFLRRSSPLQLTMIIETNGELAIRLAPAVKTAQEVKINTERVSEHLNNILGLDGGGEVVVNLHWRFKNPIKTKRVGNR